MKISNPLFDSKGMITGLGCMAATADDEFEKVVAYFQRCYENGVVDPNTLNKYIYRNTGVNIEKWSSYYQNKLVRTVEKIWNSNRSRNRW